MLSVPASIFHSYLFGAVDFPNSFLQGLPFRILAHRRNRIKNDSGRNPKGPLGCHMSPPLDQCGHKHAGRHVCAEQMGAGLMQAAASAHRHQGKPLPCRLSSVSAGVFLGRVGGHRTVPQARQSRGRRSPDPAVMLDPTPHLQVLPPTWTCRF